MDFEKEGLLDGLEGDERDARIQLVARMLEAGVSLDEIKRAVAEDRVLLLPVEQLLSGETKYSAREVADRAGIDVELLLALRRASGLPVADLDELLFDDADVEAAAAVSQFMAAGLPADGIVNITRIFGELTARTASATRNFVAEVYSAEEGIDEHTLSIRLAEAARDLRPLTVALIDYLYRLHMRELIRNEVAVSSQLNSGVLAGLQEVAVCFVDLVGFTRLGESVPAEELGGLATRLAALVGDLVEPPVRLIKMVGDAGMLVSDDVDAMLDAALSLVAATERQPADFPELKAGVAHGEAVHRWGDWYGSPVNIASRVTSIARPGSVLVTEDVRKRATGEYQWSFAGARRLKGVKREVGLYRVRRLPER